MEDQYLNDQSQVYKPSFDIYGLQKIVEADTERVSAVAKIARLHAGPQVNSTVSGIPRVDPRYELLVKNTGRKNYLWSVLTLIQLRHSLRKWRKHSKELTERLVQRTAHYLEAKSVIFGVKAILRFKKRYAFKRAKRALKKWNTAAITRKRLDEKINGDNGLSEQDGQFLDRYDVGLH